MTGERVCASLRRYSPGTIPCEEIRPDNTRCQEVPNEENVESRDEVVGEETLWKRLVGQIQGGGSGWLRGLGRRSKIKRDNVNGGILSFL